MGRSVGWIWWRWWRWWRWDACGLVFHVGFHRLLESGEVLHTHFVWIPQMNEVSVTVHCTLPESNMAMEIHHVDGIYQEEWGYSIPMLVYQRVTFCALLNWKVMAFLLRRFGDTTWFSVPGASGHNPDKFQSEALCGGQRKHTNWIWCWFCSCVETSMLSPKN